MARPRKDKSEKKAAIVATRTEPALRQAIEEAAELAGLTLSDWLREAALKQLVREAPWNWELEMVCPECRPEKLRPHRFVAWREQGEVRLGEEVLKPGELVAEVMCMHCGTHWYAPESLVLAGFLNWAKKNLEPPPEPKPRKPWPRLNFSKLVGEVEGVEDKAKELALEHLQGGLAIFDRIIATCPTCGCKRELRFLEFSNANSLEAKVFCQQCDSTFTMGIAAFVAALAQWHQEQLIEERRTGDFKPKKRKFGRAIGL